MPILKAEPQCFPESLIRDLADGAFKLGTPDRNTLHTGSPEFASLDMGEFDAEPVRRWWVVHTKPRQEKSLARDLFKHKIPYYLPQVPRTSVVRGRKQTSYAPVFPSYAFIFATDLDRHADMKINRIANWIRVANPAELTRQLFSLSRLVEGGAPLTVESRLTAGDRVRVKSGPLAGVEGTVVARRRKCRLIVAISLIQQGVSVEIDDHLLEAI